MKRLLIAVVALSFSFPALAEWVSYQRNADNEELYDPQFINRNGGMIKLWTLTDYAQPITSLEGQELRSDGPTRRGPAGNHDGNDTAFDHCA